MPHTGSTGVNVGIKKACVCLCTLVDVCRQIMCLFVPSHMCWPREEEDAWGVLTLSCDA